MVRLIGETADNYARRTEEPQREGESDEAYRKRIEARVADIEAVHGPDSEKFITRPDGTKVLKEPYLQQGGEIIEGTARETHPPKPVEGRPSRPAIEGKPQPPQTQSKPEGTGQIG